MPSNPTWPTAGRLVRRCIALLVSVLVLPACGSDRPTPTAVPAPARPVVRLATTQAVEDSGLLALLLPAFEQQTGYRVQPLLGSADEVLRRGERGEADVLLVDAPDAEQTFERSGAGVDRRLVMHAGFVLLGSAADPAHVAGRPLLAALQQIAASGATFVSRRDGSDANLFELQLWQAAEGRDVQHEGWYVSVHAGGEAALREASRRQAYTLSDRATYLAFRDPLKLRVLLEEDPALRDPYHVIAVNAAKWPGVNAAGARALAAYLLSPAGQALIGTTGRGQYGQALFAPDANQDGS